MLVPDGLVLTAAMYGSTLGQRLDALNTTVGTRAN